MSTRDYICGITSIAPIREAVACGDDSLVEAVVSLRVRMLKDEFGEEEQFDEEESEFREFAESMIKCKSPPKKEPGCWIYVIDHLARHYDLEPNDDLPFNEGFKHSWVWGPYRRLVKKRITRESLTSLHHLDDGRPLRGKRIDYDGCLFAWLTAEEVKELYGSLSKFEDSVIADEDLMDFHETLVESLQIVSGESKALFLGAH